MIVIIFMFCLPKPLSCKHKALESYSGCDEYWLVMVDRFYFEFLDNGNISCIPSLANVVGDNKFAVPVVSDFSKVFRFSFPSQVFTLKD